MFIIFLIFARLKRHGGVVICGVLSAEMHRKTGCHHTPGRREARSSYLALHRSSISQQEGRERHIQTQDAAASFLGKLGRVGGFPTSPP